MKFAVIDREGAAVALLAGPTPPAPWPDCDVIQVSEVQEVNTDLFDEFGRCRYKGVPNRPLERLGAARWPFSDYAKRVCQGKAIRRWDALADRANALERWQANPTLRRLVKDRGEEYAEIVGQMDAVEAALRGL